MNKQDLYSAFDRVDPDLVARSRQKDKYKTAPSKPKTAGKTVWVKRVLPVAACLVLAVGVLLGLRPWADRPAVTGEPISHTGSRFYAVAEPVIPEQIAVTDDDPYNEVYYKQTTARRNENRVDSTLVRNFLAKTTQSILTARDGNNKLFSPTNLYIATAMLADCTAGTSQEQILRLLGVATGEEARAVAKKLVRGNYVDDGTFVSRIGNSLWTGNASLRKEGLQQLSQNYYAPIYTGDPCDAAYTKAFQNWLKEASGHLLDSAAEKMTFSQNMALTLASSLYFDASWQNEFLPAENTVSVFHGATADETVTMMNRTEGNRLYTGSNFTAAELQLSGGGTVLFLLPDEGVTPEEAVASDDMTLLLTDRNRLPSAYRSLRLSVPQFDVSSDWDLAETMADLGVTAVFDSLTSDFSPICDHEGLCVSVWRHAARVSVDEEGVVGAAQTVIMIDEKAMFLSDDPVPFVLDRPFAFAVIGDTGDVLFTGVVNQTEN